MILAPYYLMIVLAWCVGVVAFVEIGRRVALRYSRSFPESAEAGFGALEGCLFALFGLLIAFTFSGAASRFDERRQLIAEEANDIGTAYLRLDLLPAAAQPDIRSLFATYVDSRLETYRSLPDVAKAERELKNSQALQKQIWQKSLAATTLPGSHVDAAKLLLPALNSMFDITTTRTMAMKIHPPAIIYFLLFVVGIVCAMFIGHRTARAPRSGFHVLTYAVVTAVSFYVILDLEYPRTGLIDLREYDQTIVDVLEDIRLHLPAP